MGQKQLYSKTQQLETGDVNNEALRKLERVQKAKVLKPKVEKAATKIQIVETKQMKVRCSSCNSHEYHLHTISVTDKTRIDARGAVQIDTFLGSTVYND